MPSTLKQRESKIDWQCTYNELLLVTLDTVSNGPTKGLVILLPLGGDSSLEWVKEITKFSYDKTPTFTQDVCIEFHFYYAIDKNILSSEKHVCLIYQSCSNSILFTDHFSWYNLAIIARDFEVLYTVVCLEWWATLI